MCELDREAFAALEPALILTQDLCRVCALPAGTVEDACRLIGTDAEVLSVDPHSLDDVLQAIEEIGIPVLHAAASELSAIVDCWAGGTRRGDWGGRRGPDLSISSSWSIRKRSAPASRGRSTATSR